MRHAPRRRGGDTAPRWRRAWRAENHRDVVAMPERHHAVAEAGVARAVGDLRHARRRRADEEQPRPRPACGDGAHGREHLFPPSPGADADLGDEQIVAGETELAAAGRAVDAGMKAIEVGAGVNDLDLLWRDAGADEAALDRVTHGHDRLDAAGR